MDVEQLRYEIEFKTKTYTTIRMAWKRKIPTVTFNVKNYNWIDTD